MEQKPHKKEELMIANSVLKLAENLIKVGSTQYCDIVTCMSVNTSTAAWLLASEVFLVLY